ncbi:MAG: hypothetical protein ACPL0A_02895 [Candidatus Micrarchaeia archaeon]
MEGPLKVKKKLSKTAAKPALKGKLLEKEKLTHATGESEMVVTGEIAKPSEELKGSYKRGEDMAETRWDIFFAYFFGWLGGIVLWLLNKEERTRFHCVQSIVTTVLSFFIIGIFVWLYALYVGWKAAHGTDVEVPVITGMLKKK